MADRTLVAVRLKTAALEQVDRRATEAKLTRSEMLRQLCRLGMTEWDKGRR